MNDLNDLLSAEEIASRLDRAMDEFSREFLAMQLTSEPITPALRDLDEWKRYTVTLEDSRGTNGLVDYVTAEFHSAFVAEMKARWDLDIAKLRAISRVLR